MATKGKTKRKVGAMGRTATRRATKRAPKVAIAVPEGWTVEKGGKAISLQLKTKDFLEAVDVINALAPVAEELDHHPDFHLERWNRLRITTYSHDVGKLTDRDERLAQRISEVLAKRGLEAQPPGGAKTTRSRQG